MYVMDGFTHDVLAMQEPSVTKRFGTSCDWLCAFNTDVFGSRPMRTVPISWTLKPIGALSSYVRTFLHPAASSISAHCVFMSSRRARSLPLHDQWMCTMGMPH